MFKLKEGKIKTRGLFILLTVSLVSELFLGVPGTMVQQADSAAWLLILAAAITAAPGIFFLTRLLAKFPGKNIIQITQILWGRVLAVFVGLTITGFFLFLSTVVVREFAETILVTVLPSTPISVIIFAYTLAMILGAYNGLEVVTRSCTLLFPFIVIGIVSILLLTGNFINFNSLFPVFGSGLGKIALNAPGRSSLYAEIILAGLVAANINDTAKVPQAVWKALLVSVGFYVLVELFYVADFRVSAAEKMYVPLFQLARLIYMGRFVQRIESLYIFVWFFIGALKLTIDLYAAATAFSWTFKIPMYQPLLFPFGLLVFSLSFIPSGIVTAINLDMGIIRMYGGLITWGIPLALWVTSFFRRKGGKQPEKQQQN